MTIAADTLIASWRTALANQKKDAESAFRQLSEAQLHQRISPNTNPAAVIIQHLCGNMLSRWTNWLTADGEKPDRNRDQEFIDQHHSRQDLMALWELAWATVFAAIDNLKPDDLGRTVTIRGQPHSVPDAVHRQIAHYAYHAGQLHLIARSIVGDTSWRWQTIPPGKTREFNDKMAAEHGPFKLPRT